MDTGEGRFIHRDTVEKLEELATKYEKAGGIFSIGETVELRGSVFRVRKITRKDLILRLKKR